MRRRAGLLALLFILVIVVDFLTLGNYNVTSSPALHKAGGCIILLAGAGLAYAIVTAARGRAAAPPGAPPAAPPTTPPGASPAAPPGASQAAPPGAPPQGTEGDAERGGECPQGAGQEGGRNSKDDPSRPKPRFRLPKILLALAILISWLVVVPVMIHRNMIAKTPDHQPGPWIVDVFFSLYVLATQAIVPTPFALAFWPSMIVGLYFLFSRKDRLFLDPFAGIAALGLLFALFKYLIPR